MDWLNWTPREHAVLCFIVQNGQVLLIHKKRGLGAGKVNAPGGKLEPGETPHQAALRETEEEVGVVPLGLVERGLLHFQFTDGYSLQCTVFQARGYTGEFIETAEAIPFWAPVGAVPYDQMWADDQHWLPQMLCGRSFRAWFEFADDVMLSKQVEVDPARRVLVAGCGYLGLAAARLFAMHGWEVTGCTHSPASAAALAGEPLRAVTADLASRESVQAIGSAYDAIIHCASSGRGGAEAYQQVYVEGARNLVDVFSTPLLFTSSTSVYAQTDGDWVTEESPATPDRETGQLLRAAEEIALGSGGCIARLAGLYGPGRSVLLRKFVSGEAVVEGEGTRWLNQIHRDDAATALVLLAETRARGIFNVADDVPMGQRALYHGMAERLQSVPPPTGPMNLDRKRGWTHKRVANTKLRRAGWVPRYPSFFDALDDGSLLAALQSA